MRHALLISVTLALLSPPIGAEDLSHFPLLAEICAETGIAQEEAALRDLLHLHMQSVMAIDTDRALFPLSTLPDMERAALVISREAAAVGERDLVASPEVSQWNPEAFDRAHLTDVFRLLLMWEQPLTREDLEAELDRLHFDPSTPDLVYAKQIFVEINPWTDRETARHRAEEIMTRLASEEFHAVAREYYESVGLIYDGRIGHLRRGEIPEENFERLWTVPRLGVPCGPIETPEGFLIVQVDERIPSGAPDAAERFGDWFRERTRQSRAERELEQRLASEEALWQVERIDHGESPPAPPDPLYRIGDRTVTFQEARERFPHVFGDSEDPRFSQAIRERAVTVDLLTLGSASAEIHASPVHRWLLRSQRNAWLVQRCLDELAESIDDSDEAVEQFYRDHLDELYRRPDRVSVATVHVPVSVEGGIVARRLARREAFALARRLREAWVADP
ncbi:peptidylprolyl isomerase, partial [Candidatus Sumerlaeota bacterium]|nr:peptidylprolyl isomerase [Candidatus Sumerlaeota bacterium]